MTVEEVRRLYQAMFNSNPKPNLTHRALIEAFMQKSGPTKSKTSNRRNQPTDPALQRTDYTIVIDYSQGPPRCAGVDAAKITRHIQEALRKVSSPLDLLSGRWSAQTARKNFMYSFGGKPNLGLIQKYDSILTSQFRDGCRGVPSAGYQAVVLNGVPILRDADGMLVDGETLRCELKKSPVCRTLVPLALPRWITSDERLPHDQKHSSVIFTFYDPDGSGYTRLQRSPPALFGRFTTV
jgi:hypothetical protein